MSERKPKPVSADELPVGDSEGQTEAGRPFSKFGPREDEVSFEEVGDFLDNPESLPPDKIPSLVKYFGHIGEVAKQLLARDDVLPEVLSTICQLHGSNPKLAQLLMEYPGQLADESNRHLHQSNPQNRTLTLNHLYHQNLPGDINWELYDDYPNDRFVLQVMARRQPDLDPALVRRFYDDHHHQPRLVIDLVIGQKLPEDIVRQAFADYRYLSIFIATLFQHQRDLPAEIITQAYNDYDRSFEPIIMENSIPADALGELVFEALEQTLPNGGSVIDLASMRLIVTGQTESDSEGLLAEILNLAQCEHQAFMNFVINLLQNNQLDQEMIRLIYDDLGRSQAVVWTMLKSQPAVPLDIVRQACEVYGQEIEFVKILFENQNGLPRDIIKPLYNQHRWSPRFDGSWLGNQSSLTEKERKEASSWRLVDLDPQADPQGDQAKRIGAVLLSPLDGS